MDYFKKAPILLISLFVTLMVVVSACSGGNSTTPASTSNPATITSATFQTHSASGQTVYASSCAKCHGSSGQGGGGPALWGSGATLGTYNGNSIFNKNAQDMLNFIATKMPLTAPGSLTHDQYLDVLSYILVQGNQVNGSTSFNESQLSTITLK